MRNAFISSLLTIAQHNSKVVLLTGDLGYTVFEPFKIKFPQRFFNMGAAEANMIGVALGMSKSGLIPIVYSIATFATMRGFEQIRTDICLHNANVKIIGTGAGLSYGHAGPTHHALEDIALMRLLPNMTIICPSDPLMAKVATEKAILHKGPIYLRLGKRGEPAIHKELHNFEIGKGIWLRRGEKIAIIATGNLVHTAVETAAILRKAGFNPTIIDMHTIKPIDTSTIKKLLINHTFVYTLEEHSIIGGIGSAVAETIAELRLSSRHHFARFGIRDTFIDVVGNQNYLRSVYKLTPQHIAAQIKKDLKTYV